MAQIAIQTIPKNGSAVITFATVDGGGTDDVSAQPDVVVLFKNTAGSPENVTQTSIACSHGRTITETVAVPATTGEGAFNPGSDKAQWTQTDGNFEYTHSGAATLSVAAVKFV